MDEADRGNDEAERGLASILRKRLPVGPVATGRCLYCGEILDEHQRWCDADCRNAWDKEARRGN